MQQVGRYVASCPGTVPGVAKAIKLTVIPQITMFALSPSLQVQTPEFLFELREQLALDGCYFKRLFNTFQPIIPPETQSVGRADPLQKPQTKEHKVVTTRLEAKRW